MGLVSNITAKGALLAFTASASLTKHSGEAVAPFRYIAIGASETLPFGVQAAEGYPQLVARHCRLSLTSDASSGTPSLSIERIPNVTRSDDVSLIVGPADIILFNRPSLSKRIGAIFARLSHAARVRIVMAPPIRTIPAFAFSDATLVQNQLELLRLLRIRTTPYHNFKLVVVGSAKRDDFLMDGVHPSVQGQRYLARLIEKSLGC